MAHTQNTHGLRIKTGLRAGMRQAAGNSAADQCAIDNMSCLSNATNDSQRNMCAILYDNCIGAQPGTRTA